MLAIDVLSSLLIVGVVLLCATTAVATLNVPGIDWSTRRRSGVANEAGSLDELVGIDRASAARRVVTGRSVEHVPAVLPHLAASIEMPAAPTGQDAKSPDGSRLDGDPDVAAAEAFITELLDENPQRLADLMLHWIASDRTQTDRTDPA